MKPKDIPLGYDYCKDCDSVKPMSEFYNTPSPYCKKHQNERTRKAPNYKANVRKSKLKNTFGITPEEYDKMAKAQNYLCGICLQPETSKGKENLAVDHDHITGFVRGLLCHNCNTAIGKLKDDVQLLKSAIFYIEKTNQVIQDKIRQTLLNNMEDN